MGREQVINSLKKNGFTEYESKIYISLLETHPANGNMIALSSGVPGPKVYEALRRMQEKGYVYSVFGGDKSQSRRYSPIPYQDLLKMFEEVFVENYHLLEREFKTLATSVDLEWKELFHIDGYGPSIQAIKDEIEFAEKQILISAWSKEINVIYDYLLRAHERGVKIVSTIFDEYPIPTPWVNVRHFTFESSKKRHDGELNIVFDNSRVIILEALSEYAVVSSHQSLVNITVNYIRHDIYINKVIDDFKASLKEKYGENLEGLVDWF
ncbi:helix-turn-helix domain-containing protein [Sporosarcina sp. FSL W8-0480]|uniref:TrmB family transcriptional regulator n=1 Tax=Sporosarcina sp. FSL W8-0480 TaxID=2954701 RepID=UPI0030DB7701